MREFRIHFSEEQLDDLRRRIDCTRLPRELKDKDWRFGTDGGYLQSLFNYWCDGYDWRQKETELNRYAQFICELDGMDIHLVIPPFLIELMGRKSKALLLFKNRWTTIY